MERLNEAVQIIKNSSNIVAFTGAGVSTESNIPDFRSSNGLYNDIINEYEFPPEVMLSYSFFMEHTDIFFNYYRSKILYPDAEPNDCHLALAQLEKMGKLRVIITQNIDGLHQTASSCSVLELHGSVNRNYCMDCSNKYELDYMLESAGVIPLCDKCGGKVRPDVVLYEEILDQDILQAAVHNISKADTLIVLGTSLVVHPAAGLIKYYRGDNFILINKSTTPYDDMARIVIRGSAGQIMKKIMSELQAM